MAANPASSGAARAPPLARALRGHEEKPEGPAVEEVAAPWTTLAHKRTLECAKDEAEVRALAAMAEVRYTTLDGSPAQLMPAPPSAAEFERKEQDGRVTNLEFEFDRIDGGRAALNSARAQLAEATALGAGVEVDYGEEKFDRSGQHPGSKAGRGTAAGES